MNITFDGLIVKQAINDIDGFTLGADDDRRIEKQVSFINKAVYRNALVLSEILERIIGIQ